MRDRTKSFIKSLIVEYRGDHPFFFSSGRRHTRFGCDWSSDVCSSDLKGRPRSSPRAKKRGELRGRPFGRQVQAVARIGEHLLGVTAVPRVPGKARPLAEILAARAAIEEIGRASCRERGQARVAGGELE